MTREQQIEFIKSNYLKMPVRHIRKHIGRSRTFVIGVLKRNGLEVPEETKRKFIEISRFKKGHTPMNKGVSVSEWMPEDSLRRSEKGRFKKGHKPGNTLEEYAVTVRTDKRGNKYKWIRIDEEWIPLHRFEWELWYGEIPETYIVQFKDGDTMNCDWDNLYLVKRSDQVVVNRQGGYKNEYELRETLKLTANLKRKINEKQNQRPQ